MCEDLATRGVRAPQLCVIGGGKGLRAAVEQTWPAAAIQRCAVHKLRNLLTTAPRRLHDELRVDYHAIVFAEDGAAARRAYMAFVEAVGQGLRGRGHEPDEAGASCSPYIDTRAASGRAGARPTASNVLIWSFDVG